MRICTIQHVAFEQPGVIEDWAIQNNHEFHICHIYKRDYLPKVNNFDFLVVMGGPMSFDDEDKYPWIIDEINTIEQFVSAGKAVLGICLGAQFVVRAIGGQAKHGSQKEIGWYPVKNIKEGWSGLGLDAIPESLNVFHWHTDTFDIPEGAVHLSKSEAFPNQAYQYKNNVLGLQFHLEVKPENVMSLVENCGEDITDGKYIQSEEEILIQQNYYRQNNILMFKILDKLISF